MTTQKDLRAATEASGITRRHVLMGRPLSACPRLIRSVSRPRPIRARTFFWSCPSPPVDRPTSWQGFLGKGSRSRSNIRSSSSPDLVQVARSAWDPSPALRRTVIPWSWVYRHLCRQSGPLPEAALRSDEELRAGERHRERAQHAGRPSGGSGKDASGAHRLRQAESGQAELRVRRHRQRGAHRDGGACRPDGHEPDPRSLSWHRARP